MSRDPQTPEQLDAALAKLESDGEALRRVLAATISDLDVSPKARAEFEAAHARIRASQANLRTQLELLKSARHATTRFAADGIAAASLALLRERVAKLAIPARPTSKRGAR